MAAPDYCSIGHGYAEKLNRLLLKCVQLGIGFDFLQDRFQRFVSSENYLIFPVNLFLCILFFPSHFFTRRPDTTSAAYNSTMKNRRDEAVDL